MISDYVEKGISRPEITLTASLLYFVKVLSPIIVLASTIIVDMFTLDKYFWYCSVLAPSPLALMALDLRPIPYGIIVVAFNTIDSGTNSLRQHGHKCRRSL